MGGIVRVMKNIIKPVRQKTLLLPPKPPEIPKPPKPQISQSVVEKKNLVIEEREARLGEIKRRRRGRMGTIHSSWRGLELNNSERKNTGKKLLGE